MISLVTGGAGFIGSHLTDYLIENGSKAIVIDNLSTGEEKNINKQADFIEGSLEEINLKKFFKKLIIYFMQLPYQEFNLLLIALKNMMLQTFRILLRF